MNYKYSKSSLNVISRFLDTVTVSETMCNEPVIPWADWCEQELSSYSIFLVTEVSPNFQMKTQNISDFKHRNKCELYRHLKMNQDEIRIFQLVHGHRWLESLPDARVWGGIMGDALPLQVNLHPLTLTMDGVDTPFTFHAQPCDEGGSWSPWRKPTQTWGPRAHSLPGQDAVSFPEKHCNETMWNKMTLFKELLYYKLLLISYK